MVAGPVGKFPRGVLAEGELMQEIEGLDEPLRLATQLARLSTLTSIVELSLTALFGMFDADIVVFGVAGIGDAGAAVYPRTDTLIKALESEAGLIWENGPLTRWCRSHPSWSPVRISSILTEQEWLHVPFYRDTAQRIGATFLLYVPVFEPDTSKLGGYFIGRAGHDFSESDMRAAARLQPILIVTHAPYLKDLTRRSPLTPRQHSVLELTSRGLTAHAIGSRLGISSHTVHKHLNDAYQRLGTHDRASAVLEFRARGLSETPPNAWQNATISGGSSPRSDRRQRSFVGGHGKLPIGG